MALLRGKLFAGALFAGLLLGHQTEVTVPAQPQVSLTPAGGAIRHQNRKRRRIPPDEEIDLKNLQLAADVSIQPSTQVRPRAIRRREEELLT